MQFELKVLRDGEVRNATVAGSTYADAVAKVRSRGWAVVEDADDPVPAPATAPAVVDEAVSRLASCPDCGRTVSRSAPACPGCGCPFPRTQRSRPTSPTRRGSWIGALAAVLSASILVGFVFRDSLVEGGLMVVVVAGSTAVYFLPSLVASIREHRNASSIGVVNLFLGWTLVGWVVALAWAFTAGEDD